MHHIDLKKLEQGEKGQPVEYLKAVAWALAEEGLALRGCNAAIGGNIPLGGGLSSSASLELAQRVYLQMGRPEFQRNLE